MSSFFYFPSNILNYLSPHILPSPRILCPSPLQHGLASPGLLDLVIFDDFFRIFYV